MGFTEIAGFGIGFVLVSVSMAMGFHWAFQDYLLGVYAAGFTAWTGYLVAHYSATGVFVDVEIEESASDSMDGLDGLGEGYMGYIDAQISGFLEGLSHIAENDGRESLGFLLGALLLVTGIAVLAFFVAQEDPVFSGFGSGLFFLGYIVAHYYETGLLL